MAKRARHVSTDSRMTLVDEERDEVNPTPQESQMVQESSTQPLTLEQTNNTTGTSSQKRRGVTMGCTLKKKRRWNEKLDVVLHPIRNRIVGENSKDIKTEAGVLIKQFSSIQHTQWKEVPTDIKRKMWLGLKQKFNLEEHNGVKKIVFEQLNRQFKNYRRKLHEHYLNTKNSKDPQPPKGVRKEDWQTQITYFESEKFKKVSELNKKNRSKLKLKISCGTKSIAQTCYEMRDPETGEEPTRSTAWRRSHYSEKQKKWVDEESQKVYEQLMKLQTETGENGEDPMSEDEAFVKVLGEEKPNRLRGCGDGLKPPSKRGERVNLELQKENEDLRKRNEEMASKVENLEAQINNQVQAQVEAILKAQLPTLLQSLSQINQPPSSND